MTRRTWTCATCRIEHTCTLSLVALFCHSSHHMAQGRSHLSFHFHPIHAHAWLSLSVSLHFSTFCRSSTSSSLFSTDGDSVTINNLRDSANGTFVTLDDYVSLTGYEPNAMEFTNATELNDGVSSGHHEFQAAHAEEERRILQEELCWMNSEKRLSLNMVRKFFITKSLQVEQNKIAEFYKKNYCDNNSIFVKSINKILLR